MPEVEAAVGLGGQELRVDARLERGEGGTFVELCQRRKEVPVEPAPEHGCGGEDGASVVAEHVEAPADAVDEGDREYGLDRRCERPSIAMLHERARRDARCEQFLHEERHTVSTVGEGEQLA